jgi:hypothetical protein
MMQAARQGATGERDYCLILLAFRHGMRISELLDAGADLTPALNGLTFIKAQRVNS